MVGILGVVFVVVMAAMVLPMLGSFSNSTQYQPGVVNQTEQAASYIIFKDGDFTCAKNGSTSRIDYKSLNATGVIQSVIDRVDGGYIQIKSGIYEVTGLTLDKRSLTLKGENMGSTFIKLQNDSNTNLFTAMSSRQFYKFEDLALCGNSAANTNSSGIALVYDQVVTINRCWIYDFANNGISASRCNALEVFQTYINNCNKGGVYIEKSHGTVIRDSIIEYNGLTGDNSTYGVKITDGDGVTTAATIEGNWFENDANYSQYDHVIVDAEGVWIQNNRFQSAFVGNAAVHLTSNAIICYVGSNFMMNQATGKYSIVVDSGAQRNVLYYNIMSGTSRGYQDLGQDTTIMDNYASNQYIFNGTLVYRPSEIRTVNASSTITPDSSCIYLSSASNINMTSNPTISDGVPGQILILINAGENDITLNDQYAGLVVSNIRLNTPYIYTLVHDSATMFVFSIESNGSGVWCQL